MPTGGSKMPSIGADLETIDGFLRDTNVAPKKVYDSFTRIVQRMAFQQWDEDRLLEVLMVYMDRKVRLDHINPGESVAATTICTSANGVFEVTITATKRNPLP